MSARSKLVVAGAAIVVTLLIGIGAAFLFATRPATPAITVRHLNSTQSGNSIRASFEITNHTGACYIALPDCVEVRLGAVWTNCFSFGSSLGYSQMHPENLDPHSRRVCSFVLTNVPTAAPLRLKMVGQKALVSGPFGFLVWLKWRYVKHDNLPWPGFLQKKAVSQVYVFQNPIQLVSDEFVPVEQN